MRFLLGLIRFVSAGRWLGLGYVAFGIIACIFIITIPLRVAGFRVARCASWPSGMVIVDTDRLPPGRRPLHSL